ncbi:hypothetical protein [Polyangium aurulentum]|uniref:hypothetical protein n=1 Tax=Polyangium aurulentum TaxID=2567896 RepID=UPI0010AE2CD5|nr:hypothetical protein [Polyangium aurulentum]UQA56511.1 hypothetical protein E8A73_035135 [Polyangium aurulentum]
MDASQKRPTAGVRYALERVSEEGATTTYRGFAHVPDADLPLEVSVTRPEGEGTPDRAAVRASLGAEVADAADLEKEATALVKAAARAARDAGRSLPRRIVRWRG